MRQLRSDLLHPVIVDPDGVVPECTSQGEPNPADHTTVFTFEAKKNIP